MATRNCDFRGFLRSVAEAADALVVAAGSEQPTQRWQTRQSVLPALRSWHSIHVLMVITRRAVEGGAARWGWSV